MDENLVRLVWERAGGQCEYCQIPQAASLLRARKAGLPVVLLTDSADAPGALTGPNVHLVVKPFQVAQLAELADRILRAGMEVPTAASAEGPHR